MATIVPRARARPSRMALPLPPFASAWMIAAAVALSDAVEHLARAVGRAVVDDENLARHGQANREQPLDHVPTVRASL